MFHWWGNGGIITSEDEAKDWLSDFLFISFLPGGGESNRKTGEKEKGEEKIGRKKEKKIERESVEDSNLESFQRL